ncbi:hypothetical protein EJB05_14533 [Eragrostis curvula]|uniref:Uncharacterized protein n=1 Tax=Eragrostis curvula TaxID=38414 RepID=A0A5J9VZD3_9POAL|nr:hypothetical protein EJB05_14533 [Eragrostis curvula]
MALRYLARKVGIPALRRASRPRVSPSAGSRPLTSSTSRGGHNNGPVAGGAKKPGKDAEENVDEFIARFKAKCEANREAIRQSIKDDKIGRRMVMGSGVAGLGFAAATTR